MTKNTTKIRFWSGPPNPNLHAATPWEFRLFVVPAALSMVGTLLYGVATTLGDGASLEGWWVGFVVVVFFVIPFLIVTLVGSDSPWARLSIFSFLWGLAVSVVALASSYGVDEEIQGTVLVVATILASVISLHLFRAERINRYVSVVRDEIDEEISSGVQGRTVARLSLGIRGWTSRFFVVLEYGFVVLVLLLVVLSCAQTTAWGRAWL